jgi:nuclear transport factor 2 (NTF2) superfamily protein
MSKYSLNLALLGVLAGSFANAQDDATLTPGAVESWLASYEGAWETRDAEAAAVLFSNDAQYHETPFAEPFQGRSGIRDYWARVTADQRDIDFEADLVAVDGRTAVVRWRASFASISSGALVELDGVFLLQFDASDRCTVLREWWHAR